MTKTKTKNLSAKLNETAANLPESKLPETVESVIPINKEMVEEKPTKLPEAQLAETDYKRFKLMPDEFINSQDEIEDALGQKRQRMVYADSFENACGYESLIRIIRDYCGEQVAYLRCAEGGSLSLEEARAKVYRKRLDDKEIKEKLEDILCTPLHWVSFLDLYDLNRDAPVVAQNVWELVKRDARDEFESGHLAANSLEPIERLRDAWNRARYLAIRESFIDEWRPKGGIELSMIDSIVQAWLQLQYWTEETVKRAKVEPRREAYEYSRWKEQRRTERKVHNEPPDYWDVPTVSESEALNQAATMVDRFQRMYVRAIRTLRDWRRYIPQVTINNPNQVNIAADGGQQVSVSNVSEDRTNR